MLTVVVFCWQGERPIYGPWHVENARRMFARHLQTAHRFVCVSDDPSVPGYHPIWPLPPVAGKSTLRNYVKLGLLGKPGEAIGGQILCADLDIILRRNIDDLPSGAPLKCLHWRERPWLQGGFIELAAGSRPEIWEAAHDQAFVTAASLAHCGTDQSVLSAFTFAQAMAGDLPIWTEADGFSINDTKAPWRVFLSAAWPKPWERECRASDEYHRQSGREKPPAPPPPANRHRMHRWRV